MMKERSFKVIAGPLNERGYVTATSFQELEVNYKRQPSTIYILGMLPGEEGIVKTFKTKREIFYAHVVEFTKKSIDRVEPKDIESYLASSPLQIFSDPAELNFKKEFISKFFNTSVEVVDSIDSWGYRNKVEFGFYEDYENYNLYLSFFKREGNSGKYILTNGTSIADSKINNLGLQVVEILRNNKVSGKSLKSLLIRSTNQEVIGSLYVTVNDLFIQYPKLEDQLSTLPISIIFSDKKSPASINNGFLKEYKSILTQSILNMEFDLALDGFFQINIPTFEKVIIQVKEFLEQRSISGTLLDLYCGVGVIGQLLASNFESVIGVDSSLESELLSNLNSKKNNIKNFEYIRSEAEKIVELITSDKILFLDPPRIGCNQKIIDRINDQKPEYVFYLSCNPVTQARDYELLQDNYSLELIKSYNFYPQTPHLENLLILKKK